MVRHIVLLSLGLILSLQCFAQVLDKEYGVEGIAVLDNLAPNLFPRDFTADSLNNVYILCENLNLQNPTEADTSLFIIKVKPNGTTDESFGNEGITTLNFESDVWASAIFILNQNIIVTGRNSNGFSSTQRSYLTDFIISLKVDGSINVDFGSNGLLLQQELQAEAGQTSITSTVIGKNIFLAGLRNDTVSVWSLNNLGEINTTFGNMGILILPFEQASIGGPLVRANEENTGLYLFTPIDTETGFTKYSFACTKLHLNGTIDTIFGEIGTAYSPIIEGGFVNPPRLEWTTITNQNIFQSFSTFSNNESHYYRSKILADGTLDNTLGDSGLLEIPESQALFFLSHNKTIYTPGATNNNQIIAAYSENAMPLAEFGSNGAFEINTSTAFETSTELHFLNDSTLLGLGHYNSNNLFVPTLFKLSTSVSTSIGSFDQFRYKNLFPNPTQNTLNLPQNLSNQKLHLYNAQGQEFTVPAKISNTVDVNHLQPGVYFLRAGKRVWRFVKE